MNPSWICQVQGGVGPVSSPDADIRHLQAAPKFASLVLNWWWKHQVRETSLQTGFNFLLAQIAEVLLSRHWIVYVTQHSFCGQMD